MHSTSFSSPPLSARGATSADLRLTGSSCATYVPVHYSLRSTPRSSLRSTPLLLKLANRSGRSSPTCSMLGTSSFDMYTCSSPSDTWSSFSSWCANWPTSRSEFSESPGASRDTCSDTTRTRIDSSAGSGSLTTSSSASSGTSATRVRHHHHRGHREREEQKVKETARERSWPVLHENALVPPHFPVLELRHVPSPPPGQRIPTREGIYEYMFNWKLLCTCTSMFLRNTLLHYTYEKDVLYYNTDHCRLLDYLIRMYSIVCRYFILLLIIIILQSSRRSVRSNAR